MSGLIARRGMMAVGNEPFPEGYTRVSGIRIDNGAYAKIYALSSARAGIRYVFTKSLDVTTFNISAGGFRLIINAANNKLGFNTGATSGSTYELDATLEKHEIKLDYLQDGKIMCDGVEKGTYSGRGDSRLGVGAYLNSSANPWTYAQNIIVHLFERSQGGVIVESFVPAVRNSDNVAGFINVIDGDNYGLFYPSASSVPFVAVY